MPKLIVNVNNDKLQDVITKLVDNSISFSIEFEQEVLSTQHNTSALINKTVGAHPHNRPRHNTKDQALGSIVYKYLSSGKGLNFTTEEVAEHITSLGMGWKTNSVSSALSYLYKQEATIKRTKIGRTYSYWYEANQGQLDLTN